MNKQYLKKIKQYPRLNAEDEYNLFQDYTDGDPKAFDKLINHNLVNVYNLTLNWFRRNNEIPFNECIAEGNEVLINCLKQFDHTKNYRFYTYLSTAITNGYVKLINQYKMITLPHHKYIAFGKVSTGDESVTRDYQLYSNFIYQRLHQDDFENDSPEFDIEDEDIDIAINQEHLEHLIDLSLDYLSVEQVYIITKYYGVNHTTKVKLSDIAKQLNFSKTKTSYLKKDALERLKTIIKNNY